MRKTIWIQGETLNDYHFHEQCKPSLLLFEKKKKERMNEMNWENPKEQQEN